MVTAARQTQFVILLESITDRRKLDMNILRLSIQNFVSNLSYYRHPLCWYNFANAFLHSKYTF